MSLLPKALVTVLAPYADLPRTYLEPLRTIIIHTPFCGGRAKKNDGPAQIKKKMDEDPIDITKMQGITTMKQKAILRPADLV